MSEQEIIQILEKMSPKEAVSSLGAIVKGVFRFLDDEARLDFIKDVVGEAAEDKVSSMVHL
jgi:hypothetical protein